MIDIKFDCQIEFNKPTIKKFVKNSVDLILEMLNNKKNIYISIFLTNDDNIRKINLRFRNINKATNVLSFPQNEERMILEKGNFLILGDIVISLEKILAEAKEQNKTFNDHLLHMIVHGTLHLMGYDHENVNDAKVMERKEQDIVSKVSCILAT